jgi:signal transduction histidine kinase/DNA-binding response OmpR family regulator/HAMP domain-containing protein
MSVPEAALSKARPSPQARPGLGRLASLPLWARLVMLTTAGLFSLIGSSLYLSSALHQAADRTARMQELFDIVEAAADAHVTFGELRYWLTDLSVSLLVASERNADAARDRLNGHLDRLADYDPETVAAIRSEVDAYVAKAMDAADAYTDGNRVIGNTLLAAARTHSTKVNDELNEFLHKVNALAVAERRSVVERAGDSARVAFYIVLALSFVGAVLTIMVLRSIVQPLHRLNDAIAGLTEGRYDVDIPPDGVDELGAMARTLRLFRENAIERERLEADADRQRRLIETAIETISDGFVLFDPEERILLANSKYREIFPEAAPIVRPGISLREILEAQVKAKRVELGGMSPEQWIEQRLAQHREPEGYVDERRYGDAWVRITKRQTQDGGKVAVYTDITELKEREAELETAKKHAESASEAKSQFLASMSHELRTPLNAIIGYSEMLIEEARDREQDGFVPDLDKIAGAGRHLLMLINGILDLSKIEAGKMEIFVEQLDVETLIRDVEGTIEPLMATNDNSFRVVLDGPLGEMRSDLTKLRQNLFNLLSNAAKFTEQGEITLFAERQARADGDWLIFKITDTGIGMTQEQCDRLFVAFTQADSSTTRNYGGTGLGLSITRSFCQMIGGDITIESELGVGSTFTMEIPANCAEPAVSHDELIQPTDEESAAYVLIIDDEPSARRVIAAALSEAGFGYREASSGAEGIELARQARPLAIVLDIIMPRQDGWSVLRKLKSDPELCDIPVILATVLAERELGLALGAVEYLTKPIDSERLIETIETLCNGTRDVLVVDDDQVSRDLLRRILVKRGWTVHEAHNGVRGLEKLKTLSPHVVLLDLMMPEMNGFEMLSEMQRTPELQDIPVIIVTSKDLSSEERSWLHDHAVSVVTKDANTRSQLVAALERQIAHSRTGTSQ